MNIEKGVEGCLGVPIGFVIKVGDGRCGSGQKAARI